MKGSKKKFDSNCPYNVYLGRIYNQIDFDLVSTKTQNKIKRSFGMNKVAIKMLSQGYVIKGIY